MIVWVWTNVFRSVKVFYFFNELDICGRLNVFDRLWKLLKVIVCFKGIVTTVKTFKPIWVTCIQILDRVLPPHELSVQIQRFKIIPQNSYNLNKCIHHYSTWNKIYNWTTTATIATIIRITSNTHKNSMYFLSEISDEA